MSRTNAYVVLATLLVAGCASAPEIADEPPAAAPTVAATASPGTIVPDTVLDANELVARTPPPPICREVLKQNSNVHETRCMTAQQWKIWQQAEARNAAQIVKMMQGHPSYRR